MKKRVKIFLLGMLSTILGFCSSPNKGTTQAAPEDKSLVSAEGFSKAYFASGCFWCVEAIYESVDGVQEVISGYAGGKTPNPTYEQIGTGRTGHSETVEVIYDEKIVSFSTLIDVYYGSQDPTTVNGQHPDYGSQYRSIIFYRTEEEKKIATEKRRALENSGKYEKPIATEIKKITTFWPAEDYHQDFERLHPNQGYIKAVSIPRLNRFKSKFPDLLKSNH